MLYIYFDNITFADLAQGLLSCLKSIGIIAQLTNKINDVNFMDLYIVFGMNDFNSQVIPHNYIVYQLEQTTGQDQSQWFSTTYLKYLKGAIEVWDYSLVNYQHLKKLEVSKIKYVPLQYMPCLNEVKHYDWQDKDIDVLFYGSMNDRRQSIIQQLIDKGVNVVSKSHLWKDERSQLIARSKLILNIHYYEHSILETARVSYLLSNNCSVVSETGQDPLLDKWHLPYLKFAKYDQLCDTCIQLLEQMKDRQDPQDLQDPVSKPYNECLYQIPLDTLKQYQCFMTPPPSTPPTSDLDHAPTVPLPIVDSHDLFEAEQEITKNQELVLKLPKLSDHELPCVSIVTVTYNRKAIFPMAIRNWQLFDYPRDKLEWIIVDDSDDGSSLSHILPKSNQVKYYRLQTTGRLSIGQKRNFGVEKSSHEYVAFMDDDDYYYPFSIYARIALLIKYPQYSLVGVTDLDIYDVVNQFSARCKGSLISEASMAFRKSFWVEQPFPDKFSTLGEGYPFTKDRRNQIIKMPSCFNIIAMTHYTNYTQGGRSYDKFKHVTKKDNILGILDLSTKLFIFNLFDQVKNSVLMVQNK